MIGTSDAHAYPVGRAITLAQLETDPYPVYAQLQALEPISWVEALGMWYVPGYGDVRTIAMNHAQFATASDRSLNPRHLRAANVVDGGSGARSLSSGGTTALLTGVRTANA